jgi:hypothetical protein
VQISSHSGGRKIFSAGQDARLYGRQGCLLPYTLLECLTTLAKKPIRV